MDKMMIEVALNELATKDQNSHVPYGPEEVIKDAVACAKAGAQIIHFHARDKSGEQLWQSAETYAEAMREIKKQCDAILYPTYPGGMPGSQRIAHVVKLADNPDVRLELATLDLGATNGGRIDPVLGGFKNGGGAYVNSHNDVVDMMRALRRHSVHYSLGVRDVGHMRHIHAYAQLGLVKSPWAVKIFMSAADPHGPFPDVRGIMMYLDMVPNDVQCHWFLTTYNASEVHERLNMLAAAMGGHIRTGLGDNPVLNGKKLTNAQQVQLAVDLAHKAGRTIASPAETRQLLGMVG